MRDRVHQQRNPVLRVNLAHQLGDVGFHGTLFNTHGGADFFVRAPRPSPTLDTGRELMGTLPGTRFLYSLR